MTTTSQCYDITFRQFCKFVLHTAVIWQKVLKSNNINQRRNELNGICLVFPFSYRNHKHSYKYYFKEVASHNILVSFSFISNIVQYKLICCYLLIKLLDVYRSKQWHSYEICNAESSIFSHSQKNKSSRRKQGK